MDGNLANDMGQLVSDLKRKREVPDDRRLAENYRQLAKIGQQYVGGTVEADAHVDR